MARDHPTIVQHSQFHTQGWRANGDISIIISKSNPENPSVDEIIATERYVSGYACKGNQPTGALVELFHDLAYNQDECSTANAKSICTKLLMNTVKRDISSVEASLNCPLFHSFVAVISFSLLVLQDPGYLKKLALLLLNIHLLINTSKDQIMIRALGINSYVNLAKFQLYPGVK